MHSCANWVIRHAKLLLIIWGVLFVCMGIFAIQLPNQLEGDGFFVEDDHMRVSKELSETFGLPSKTIFVLFENKTDEEISATLNDLQNINEIAYIISPLDDRSMQNKTMAYAMLHFDQTVHNYPEIVDNIRNLLATTHGITITGEPVISKDLNTASQKDLVKAEAIGVPIAVIVLLLAFGTLVSALLPIVIGIITVIITFGILAILGNSIQLSIFILNIVPMLGLALSIDFSLLFINRYREERLQRSIEQSVHTAIQTAGRSIIFSALCVMIGLGALIIIKVELFQNIALGGFIIVLLAVLTGTTLLPSSIIVLGDRINKGRVFNVKNVNARWQWLANFVIKHPVTIVIVAVVLLVIAMIPIKDMKLTIPSADSLPTSFESRATFDTLDNHFGIGNQSTVFLLAEREGEWNDSQGLELIYDIQKHIEKHSLVKQVDSIYTTAKVESPEIWTTAKQDAGTGAMLQAIENVFIQGNKMYMSMTLRADGASNEAQDFVRELKNADLGVDFALSGRPKFNQEIFDEIATKIIYALCIIIATTFIILMIAFHSILIPLKAIVMNILGLGATFGILVYIFQYGHFGLSPGTIMLILPVLVFCLVFGLSMDYEVFLISRIQEEYLDGATNTEATVTGLVATSKIITSAALIMIVITGAFAFTNVMPVKQVGVGIAIAIAIDATIIRLMLVPSLMKLFGEWNWWLPFKKK